MRIAEKFWVGTFVILWLLVSTVSTIHSVQFFTLTNNIYLSWVLALGFEIGAMASLGGILISKGSKTLIWFMFVVLTAFQIHGNMYWAWIYADDIKEWTILFNLQDEDIYYTKRIFTFISGGILPLVSLGFIKSLIDYMKLDKSDNVINDSENVLNVENVVSKPINPINTEQETKLSDEQSSNEILDKELIKETKDNDLVEPKEVFTKESVNTFDKMFDEIEKNSLDNQKKPKTKKSKNLFDVINNLEQKVNTI